MYIYVLYFPSDAPSSHAKPLQVYSLRPKISLPDVQQSIIPSDLFWTLVKCLKYPLHDQLHIQRYSFPSTYVSPRFSSFLAAIDFYSEPQSYKEASTLSDCQQVLVGELLALDKL